MSATRRLTRQGTLVNEEEGGQAGTPAVHLQDVRQAGASPLGVPDRTHVPVQPLHHHAARLKQHNSCRASKGVWRLQNTDARVPAHWRLHRPEESRCASGTRSGSQPCCTASSEMLLRQSRTVHLHLLGLPRGAGCGCKGSASGMASIIRLKLKDFAHLHLLDLLQLVAPVASALQRRRDGVLLEFRLQVLQTQRHCPHALACVWKTSHDCPDTNSRNRSALGWCAS